MEMSTEFCQRIFFFIFIFVNRVHWATVRQIPFTCCKLHDSVFSIDSLARENQNVIFYLFLVF